MALSFKGAHFPHEIMLMGVRWYVAYHLKRSACGRTPAGAGGTDRSRDHPARSRVIQPPAGRSVAPPEACRVGQLADGRDLHQSQRCVALPLSCRRYAGPTHGLSLHRAARSGGRPPVSEAGAPSPRRPGDNHDRRERGQYSRYHEWFWFLATLCDDVGRGHPPSACMEEPSSPTRLTSWCSQINRLHCVL